MGVGECACLCARARLGREGRVTTTCLLTGLGESREECERSRGSTRRLLSPSPGDGHDDVDSPPDTPLGDDDSDVLPILQALKLRQDSLSQLALR